MARRRSLYKRDRDRLQLITKERSSWFYIPEVLNKPTGGIHNEKNVKENELSIRKFTSD